MVQIWFPGLGIPELAIPKIVLLDTWLLGTHLKIELPKIVILPATTIWKGFMLFDTDWIAAPITSVIMLIPKAVWDLCKTTLDSWARDYYEEHSKGE